MTQTKALVNLIKELSSPSLKDRNLSILNYFIYNQDFFSKEEKEEIINHYKSLLEIKINNGKKHIEKRVYKKKDKQNKDKYWVFIQAKFPGTCKECNEKYCKDDYIFCETVGKIGIHAKCANEELRQVPHLVPYYEKWVREILNKKEE